MDALTHALADFGLRMEITANDAVLFAAPNHDLIVAVKHGQGGLRDVHDAVLRLASRARSVVPKRAILLIDGVRISADGLRTGWDNVRAVLASDIADSMCLVALLDDEVVILPAEDEFLHRLGDAARAALRSRPRKQRTDRSFEVMRVLLSRWLRGEGAIAIGELQRQTGLSHPTVKKSLDALGPSAGRRRDRSVSLATFPTAAWARLLANAPAIRQTMALVDGSGRGTSATALLERLRRRAPPGVALGGVPAARHWDADLDLEGLPRVDLSVHVPEGEIDPAIIEQIDPALVPAPDGTPPLLVLHAVPRAESAFVTRPGDLLIADPVEALLDLHELRLIDQAEQLVRAMRRTG